MRGAVITAAAALLLVVAGCSSPVAEKNGTGELRTDLAPLVERFELLADIPEAAWASGTFGDSRVPGPSTYWIDAVITLDASIEERLRQLELEPADAPSLQAPVTAPDASWATSEELDELFSPEGYGSTAFLADDSPTLILQSVFE